LSSKLAMSESINILDMFEDSFSSNFKSWNLYLTPAFSMSYSFLPVILGIRTGYEWDFYRTDVLNLESGKISLPRDGWEYVKMNWSGYFVNVSVAVELN